MTDNELDPVRFGTSFKAFMDAVVEVAVPPRSPLLERIQAHMGGDPTQLPVFTEEYDTFEHPNLQVAMDAYLAKSDRQADLVGVGGQNKRFMALGLSDLLG